MNGFKVLKGFEVLFIFLNNHLGILCLHFLDLKNFFKLLIGVVILAIPGHFNFHRF